jgi:RNA-binding protein YlmH
MGNILAIKAKNHFSSVISSKNTPDDIQEIEFSDIISIICLIRKSSKTAARNLLISNAVKVNGNVATLETILKSGDVIKVGKLDHVKMI